MPCGCTPTEKRATENWWVWGPLGKGSPRGLQCPLLLVSILKGWTQIPHPPDTSGSEGGSSWRCFLLLGGRRPQSRESELISSCCAGSRPGPPTPGAHHRRCRPRSSPRHRRDAATCPRPPASPRAAVQRRSANELTNVSQVLIMSSAMEPKPRFPCPHLPLPPAQAGAVAQPLPAGQDAARPGTARSESSPVRLDRDALLAAAARRCVVRSGSPRGRWLRMLRGGRAGSPPGWQAAAAAQMCERR